MNGCLNIQYHFGIHLASNGLKRYQCNLKNVIRIRISFLSSKNISKLSYLVNMCTQVVPFQYYRGQVHIGRLCHMGLECKGPLFLIKIIQ